MSRSRKPSTRNVGSRWERLRDSFSFGRRPDSIRRRFRRLRIDALEQRTLLSVSPVNVSDVLANMSPILTPAYTYDPTSGSYTQNLPAVTAKSVAMDNNGDFVVAWQQQDGSSTSSDYNIYARYFTAAMQRITLPSNMTAGSSFQITYNGDYVQELSFGTGSQPLLPLTSTQPLINGTVVLDCAGQTIPLAFDEYNDPQVSAANIQTTLQNYGTSHGIAALTRYSGQRD